MHASQQNLIFSTTLVCVFFFSYCNSQFRCSTFPGACVEQRYQVPGRLGVLSLSVLNSDDEKLSLKSVLLMSSKTSRVKSYQWLKTLLSHSTVACDVDTISVSSKSPSHDTGDALKNHEARKNKWRRLCIYYSADGKALKAHPGSQIRMWRRQNCDFKAVIVVYTTDTNRHGQETVNRLESLDTGFANMYTFIAWRF